MNPRLEAEKAALQQRAELERLGLAAAWIDARNAVMPPVDSARTMRRHPWAAQALRIAIPLVGVGRVGRIVQMLSIGVAAYRVIRGLR
ncbi:MAG TPA: hypothetical protein VIH36_16225 [Casimicrobiaceae bacterium]|jgi:hypothetical protein